MEIMKNIKITNGEINKIVKLLEDQDSLLNSKDTNRRFSLTILWNVETNFKKLLEINQRSAEAEQKIKGEYFTEERTAPILDTEGNPTERVEIIPKYRQEYMQKMYELSMIENEIQIVTIPFELLEKYELNGAELQSIRFMVDDPIEIVAGEVE